MNYISDYINAVKFLGHDQCTFGYLEKYPCF